MATRTLLDKSKAEARQRKAEDPSYQQIVDEAHESGIGIHQARRLADYRSKVILPPAPPKKKRDNRRGIDKQAAHELQVNFTIRDIAGVPDFTNFKPLDLSKINWERRLACKEDPILDLKTYMPNVFTLPFGSFHEDLIWSTEEKIRNGGKKAIAFPRGTGKTAICRGMIIRAMKYALRQFCFFIGAKEDKAIQTLEVIKTFWYRSPLLQEDFPELAYPVYRIEGRATAGSLGQLFRSERTHLVWAGKEIQCPTMMFTYEDIQTYLEHDPDCVVYLPEHDRYIINSSGIIVRVAGIDGAIRGEADVHPVRLNQPRPDLILLDDVQKDAAAKSATQCENLLKLVNTTVSYLQAPDVSAAFLWPCTVIEEGDASDTVLNKEIMPEWDGERQGLVKKFPPGIDYESIQEEIDGKPNEQGRLWLEYEQVRRQSYLQHKNLKLANEFFRKHQEILERDFEATWPDRYIKTSGDPDMNEISAIQSLMNWRFANHAAYLSEGENRPKRRTNQGSITLSVEEIKERTTNIPRNELSVQWSNLVCFIDVQMEALYYGIFAHDLDFNGQFIDYSVFPKVNTPYFRKNQLAGWNMLTKLFFRDHPEHPQRPAKLHRSKFQAPFEAKIYHALKCCVSELLSREFTAKDGPEFVRKIRAIAIDTKWGLASDTIKRFVREFNDPRVRCYEGAPFPPNVKQLEHYNPTPGWMFEHQQFQNIQESRWVIRPYNRGAYQQPYIQSDVNRWKSFLMRRLSTPLGSKCGVVTLFKPENEIGHHMFAMHVTAELPEPITAGLVTKDCWVIKPGTGGDNEYLDIATGCMCLASICGASLKTQNDTMTRRKPSMRELYNKRKEARQKNAQHLTR